MHVDRRVHCASTSESQSKAVQRPALTTSARDEPVRNVAHSVSNPSAYTREYCQLGAMSANCVLWIISLAKAASCIESWFHSPIVP